MIYRERRRVRGRKFFYVLKAQNNIYYDCYYRCVLDVYIHLPSIPKFSYPISYP